MAIGHNAAVVYRNLADAAVITASSQQPDAPATNVKSPHIVTKWLSTSSSAYLLLDLGASTAMDTLALIGLIASTVRCRVSSVDDTGAAGNVFDSGAPEAVSQRYLQSIWLIEAPAMGRYVRFDLTQAILPHVGAGRVVIGARSTFSANYGYGWTRSVVDPSRIEESEGGQRIVDVRQKYRQIEATFGLLTQEDRDSFVEDIDYEIGLGGDLLFLADPASDDLARTSIWGSMTDNTPVVQPYPDRFSKTYRIKETL